MSQLGRYRVLRRVGRGGMAQVFEAIALGEEGFRRRVAIKRLLHEYAPDAAFVRMFLDEARIASHIHHPNVVSVLDFGVVDGAPFQVLEYVDGIDAGSLGRVMPVELALHVCAEVAHALDAAHTARDPSGAALGIVHRDVSPSNILLAFGGGVKLADFGIAIARDRTERTEAGVTKGKLAYMAPEQVLRGPLDGRADLFALGCVLCALVRGKSPLGHENALADLLATGRLTLDPELPEDVRAIAARATRRSREERYGTAREMAEALGAALSARLTQDARTILRDWLEPLRPPMSPAGTGEPPGNDELELAAVEGDIRLFSSVSTDTTRVERGKATRRRHRARRAAWIAAAAAPLAIASLVVASRAFDEEDAPRQAAASAFPTPTAAPDAAPPDASLAPTTEKSTSAAAAVPDAATPVQTKAAASQSRARRRGFLSIGGTGAHRAEIRIDGASHGHAPRQLELSIGRHVVELWGPGGQRLDRRVVRVTLRHTRARPLRLSLDGKAP